jgi:hypothetical protein
MTQLFATLIPMEQYDSGNESRKIWMTIKRRAKGEADIVKLIQAVVLKSIKGV